MRKIHGSESHKKDRIIVMKNYAILERFLSRRVFLAFTEPLSTVFVAPSFHTAVVFRGVNFALPRE
jgi:hypothetical protein